MQVMLGGKPLDQHLAHLEIVAAAEHPAIMREAVRPELKAARAQPLDRLPIDRVLRQRQVPRRFESVAFLEVGHPLHALESDVALDIVSQGDATALALRPERDVPWILLADLLQTRAQPL